MSIETTETEVKRLLPSVADDIKLKNVTRARAGLSPIQVSVRRCIVCGGRFESAGNRSCGCVQSGVFSPGVRP